MEIRNRYDKIPDWAQSFLSTFLSTQKMEREATTNVKALPKVVWNDNTFYVALDAEEGNADILNEYGNVITALKNVTSIDDVEQQLNKHIVAEVSDSIKTADHKTKSTVTKLDDELSKVADAINISFDTSKDNIVKLADAATDAAATFTDSTNNMAANTGVTTAPTTPDTSATVSSSYMQTSDPSINQSVNTAINMPTSSSANITNQQLDNAMSAQANLERNMKIQLASLANAMKKSQAQQQKLQQDFANYCSKTEKTIIKLANLVNTLQDQMHAYMNPGNIYDLDCEKAEVEHFNQTADSSARAIEVEHSVDLTVPKGRTSLKDKILQDIGTIKMPDEILVEQVETTPLEKQVTNKINDEKAEPVDVKVTIVTDTEEPAAEKSQNEQPKLDEKAIEIVGSKKIKKNTKIKMLNVKEASLFKQRICPSCGRSALALSTKNEKVQNVVCHSCNNKFGVNLNTEQIFKY